MTPRTTTSRVTACVAASLLGWALAVPAAIAQPAEDETPRESGGNVPGVSPPPVGPVGDATGRLIDGLPAGALGDLVDSLPAGAEDLPPLPMLPLTGLTPLPNQAGVPVHGLPTPR